MTARPGTYPAGGARAPEGCADGHCITCSDEAVEVTVVELLPDGFAQVDTGAGREEVSVALVDAAVGDTVVVHAREAIGIRRPPRVTVSDGDS
jgi:hydrogenase expression/formation protein HypC